MSTGEFRNLSGRAGRPGAAKGMEGITLVAVPLVPSTTAAGQKPLQRRQAHGRAEEYNNLLRRLAAEAEGEGNAMSSLAVLLMAIRDQAMRLPGIDGDVDFLEWLEEVAPHDISEVAGTASPTASARLADRLDELDAMILTAIEEARAISDQDITVAGTEEILAALWQKTFTQVSAAREAWMEEAFIKRGRGMVETVYPDPAERKRLYAYGYSPYVGRRFERVADTIRAILARAQDYAAFSLEEKLSIFIDVGGAVADDDLRAWQTFISDNLDFRLGVAIGAVVARAWSEGTDEPLDTPTLDTWKSITGLPWFAFWAKELLRWGTLDPLVAFALSLGLAKSRTDAARMQPAFLSRDSWSGQRKHHTLRIQRIHGLVDRLVESVSISKGLMREMMGGYGFSIRDTEIGRSLYADWHGVLGWWMGMPGADSPDPSWYGSDHCPRPIPPAWRADRAWDHKAGPVARDARRSRCSAWSGWCGQ